MNQTAEKDILIAPPLVLPFDPSHYLVCTMCASNVPRWSRFLACLKAMTPSIRGVRYCEGGKPPTEARPMMLAMVMGESESTNPCAGVYFPHLHLQCNRCGHTVLMSVKEGASHG